jgi:2'-5' RNA ligase
MSEESGKNQFGRGAGDSALLIPLPALDGALAPLLGRVASDGLGAHLTVLVPFLPEAELTDAVLAELRGVFAGFAAFDLVFAKTARFPDVLYLVPEPDRPIREMISAVCARWPQCPPYGGGIDDPVPHTTVVYARPEAEYDEARRALAPVLPLRTRVAAVELVVFDGGHWNLRARFPLRAAGIPPESEPAPGR